MKKMKYLSMIFMLFMPMATQVFATAPLQKQTPLVLEEEQTYLDTSVVVDCFKEPFYAIAKDEDGNVVKKQIGDKYTIYLANGMIYDKILFYDFSMREGEGEGFNSIYYVKKYDVLVVKVDYTHGYDIIVEIVKNMRLQ